jgi:hypothetical protein
MKSTEMSKKQKTKRYSQPPQHSLDVVLKYYAVDNQDTLSKKDLETEILIASVAVRYETKELC